MLTLEHETMRLRPISLYNGDVGLLFDSRSAPLPVLPLVRFTRAVLMMPFGLLQIPFDSAIHSYGCINGVVLHRRGDFQAELFVVTPDTELPPHGHPDIDSIEVYVSGDIEFILEGRAITNPEKKMGRSMIRVLPGQEHGARIGPAGGCFISVQRWLNGIEPSSVGLNWSGEPHAESHKERYKHNGRRQ